MLDGVIKNFLLGSRLFALFECFLFACFQKIYAKSAMTSHVRW